MSELQVTDWARRLSHPDGRFGLSVEALNAECFCVSLDPEGLRIALEVELGSPELYALMQERCPYVFAARPVFVSGEHLDKMAALVRAVEAVVALPAWREQVLARAPAIAGHDGGGARGAFFGYDFHATADAFGLIEINTNAGGAMLNAMLARAHRACCAPVENLGPSRALGEAFEEAIVAMFRKEWELAAGARPLRTLAIVDDAPGEQYLYPEFLLFQRLFERHGMRAVIADPRDLALRDGRLFAGDTAIDLVYNRLTDFYLEQAPSAALRAAWLAGAVVLTPHPQVHALYADKRNLVLLSDAERLEALGVPPELRAVLLQGIPRTVEVTPGNAESLWARRRQLFFKPFAGFGGRAAYRGDKLTQRVWQEIAAGGYVAQALVQPGERATGAAQDGKPLKFDLREYVYDGAVQWVAARLYQGQTTNFRTPGGGFAPVYRAPG